MTDSNTAAVEKALGDMLPAKKLPQSGKSFAPPPQRGIHELIHEVREDAIKILRKLEIIEERLVEFDRLQTSFYSGTEP